MANWKRVRLQASGVAALAGVALIVAGCGSSSSSSSAGASAPAASSAPASGGSGTGVSVSLVKGSAGSYLVGPSGRALYLWVADHNGSSSCAGSCARAWPPLLTKAAPVAKSGVTSSDLSTIKRSDGAKQVTYMGHPLYYYIGDTSSGSTTGQGSDNFGAKWWLVSSSGAAITKAASASKSSGSGSSGGSSSGSGSGGGGWG